MNAYQMKISLLGAHPPIWRRFIVPECLNFAQFIVIVNEVMGWGGGHLSSCEFPDRNMTIDSMSEPDFYSEESVEASRIYLKDMLDENYSFGYIYDFGDTWEHKIKVEKILTDYTDNFVKVTAFKGNCPPEDCGGMFAFQAAVSGDDETIEEIFGDDVSAEDILADMDTYDLGSVNRSLKTHFYLKDNKADLRTVQKIYEDYYRGKNGLFTKYDPAGTRKTASAPRKRKPGYIVSSSRNIPLADLLSLLTNAELKQLAQTKKVAVRSVDRKREMVEKIVARMLEPQVLASYIYSLTDKGNDCFERIIKDGYLMTEDDVIDCGFVPYTGYIAVNSDGKRTFVAEMVEAYKNLHSKPDFDFMRRRRTWLLKCLQFAYVIYGVIPVDILAKMVATDSKFKMDGDTLLEEIKSLPQEMELCTLVGEMLVSPLVREHYEEILKIQGNAEFVMYDREVIEKGILYFLDSAVIEEFKNLIFSTVDVDEYEVTSMVVAFSLMIVQDLPKPMILDVLKDMGLDGNAKLLRRISQAMDRLSDRLPHMKYRGAIPAHMNGSVEQKAVTAPLTENADKSGANKIIDFNSRRKEKRQK